MQKAFILFLLVVCCGRISAQSVAPSPTAALKNDLRKLVETEQAFARAAAEKGTRAAFLEFLADDGIVFAPTEANGKLVWKARPESPALLAWNPAWADISSDGKLGYTTGGWEFRPNGKTDQPNGFGEYVTLWQKQSNGKYRAVLDIGISHPASTLSTAPWQSPADAETGARDLKSGVNLSTLTDIFSNKSVANGYFNYLAEDCIVLRDGHAPFTGRRNAFLGLEKLDKEFPASSFLDFTGNTSQVSGNLMYIWGVYQLKAKDDSVKKWNFLQIWKNRAGKWEIVLDLFNRIPEKKS
ncbi:MAG TPA: hypothetical protein VIL74_06870 [Pyrinomonadaceae bacterium]|jgi:ketosteroid isomerase-like protein